MKNTKYYEIDNRKFKLEKISDILTELTILEDGELLGHYHYTGSKGYERALAEILSFSEIDARDFEEV